MSHYLKLVALLMLVVGGGILIGITTPPGDWYAALEKPFFNPPNWIFAPVWTVLYVLIAIAGWRIWTRAPSSTAMKLWWVQLALNFLWSPVFFAAQSILGALVIITALFATILAFIALSVRIDRLAALLFAPYALWVGFASMLNLSILLLN